jgi:acetylglutamate kinase
VGVSAGDLDCEEDDEIDLERVGDTEPHTEDVIERLLENDTVALLD